MSAFKVGEIVVYVGPADCGVKPHEINSEVTVALINVPYGIHYRTFTLAVNKWPGETIYTITWQDGKGGYVPEHQLRKRKPPEQPSAFTYSEIISMCNDRSITEPLTKQTERNT